jgi:hypothetical protein
MNNEPVAWMSQGGDVSRSKDYFEEMGFKDLIPLYTHPVKELTDEVWNKAFDFYCETDEGVLKFDLELRDEWKKEQLIRWKEAIRKASEK